MVRWESGYTLIWLASIALVSLVQVPLPAQPIRRPLRVITTRDGLPQSFVSGLVQDSTGFVWVSTRNGLARYDGRQFTAFHYNQHDSASLSSDVIISMTQDKHNHIWIEHESGEIDQLVPKLQRIERISQRPLYRRQSLRFAWRGWTIDTLGNLWGTQLGKGVWQYDWIHETVRHYTPQSHRLPSDTIRGLLASRDGAIWLLSPQAISQLNPATGNIRSVPLPAPIQEHLLPSVSGGTVSLHERRNGTIMWVYHEQLIIFSPLNGQIRLLAIPETPARSQCWLQTGPDGQDYVATATRVYQYNPVRGLTVLSLLDATQSNTQSLLIDRSGLIWVGTNAVGIRQIDRLGPYFDSYPSRRGFHQDLFQREFDVSLENAFGLLAPNQKLEGISYLLRSAYDRSNRLWVMIEFQVGYYDPVRHHINLLPLLPSHQAYKGKQWLMGGIRFDPAGALWVVDGHGNVAFFDTRHQRWVSWLTEGQLSKAVGFNEFVIDLAVDARAIWLTTHTKGLIRIDRVTQQIQLIDRAATRTHLPTNLLLGLQPDPLLSNRLWIGSYEGLIALDKNTMQSRVFTIADGLPDNTIYSVVADEGGYLWVSTNQGLCRFDPRTHQFRTFTTADGLPGDEFNRFHHLRLPDGRLAFSGTEGWTIFDPGAVQNDRFQPRTVLTGLKINNQTVPTTPGQSPLPVPLNELKDLVVTYAQNTLSFSFAGLEYNQPGRLQYRYQLMGYDDDWIEAGLAPLATYTQLPPGHYTLRINATNTTGQWSRHIHQLAITVIPPWWRSWWAYLSYLLLGIALLWAYIQLRTRQFQEKQERLAQQQHAKQLQATNDLRNRFFTNITHELRTPLTLILGPTEQLKAVVEEPSWQRWLSTIDRNAHQLLNLINQILDLSRLEAGVIAVEERRGDVSALVSQLVESMRPEAEAKRLQLTYVNQSGPDSYWFDADKLERIVLNLVSNALKFTQQGTITVTLQPGIRLVVEDTGTGIHLHEQERIFDRFYQADSSATVAQGSGIGLALVKELVTLQKGSIIVESQPAASSSPDQPFGVNRSGWTPSGWTRFTVELPYRKVAQSLPVPGLSPNDNEMTQTLPEERSEGDQQTLILVVEDNTELGDFIAESLPADYRVLRAADGLAGLDKALAQIPDLIISDVLMPRMDGFALCQQLKNDRRTNHIPIILLTAKVTKEALMQGLTYGADSYLTKPFQVSELQLRVRNLIDLQRRQRAWVQAQLASLTAPDPVTRIPTEQIDQQSAESTKPPASLTASGSSFLDELYSFLANHLSDTRFGVEQLADVMGLSRVHLYRKVKALSGLTATELLRNYRLKQATYLLTTGYSITDAASAVGFDSPTYFAKCFRHLYQITPSEFQARAKSNQ